MNKYMKIFLLAAVLVGTTVSIASCDKDELNAPHHNGHAQHHTQSPHSAECGDFLYIVQVACN